MCEFYSSQKKKTAIYAIYVLHLDEKCFINRIQCVFEVTKCNATNSIIYLFWYMVSCWLSPIGSHSLIFLGYDSAVVVSKPRWKRAEQTAESQKTGWCWFGWLRLDGHDYFKNVIFLEVVVIHGTCAWLDWNFNFNCTVAWSTAEEVE